MKTLKLNRRKNSDGSGAYGEYYKLSRSKGVKIIGHVDSGNGCYSINELKQDWSYKDAIKELKLLKRAYRSGVTPKPYHVAAVKIGSIYHAGIVMEHIDGYGGELDDDDYVPDYVLKDALHALEKKSGLKHKDVHNGNYIFKKTKYGWKLYLIDFSPDNIKRVK